MNSFIGMNDLIFMKQFLVDFYVFFLFVTIYSYN